MSLQRMQEVEKLFAAVKMPHVLLANTNNLLNNYIKNINIFLIKGEVEKTDLCCVSIGVDWAQ